MVIRKAYSNELVAHGRHAGEQIEIDKKPSNKSIIRKATSRIQKKRGQYYFERTQHTTFNTNKISYYRPIRINWSRKVSEIEGFLRKINLKNCHIEVRPAIKVKTNSKYQN